MNQNLVHSFSSFFLISPWITRHVKACPGCTTTDSDWMRSILWKKIFFLYNSADYSVVFIVFIRLNALKSFSQGPKPVSKREHDELVWMENQSSKYMFKNTKYQIVHLTELLYMLMIYVHVIVTDVNSDNGWIYNIVLACFFFFFFLPLSVFQTKNWGNNIHHTNKRAEFNVLNYDWILDI